MKRTKTGKIDVLRGLYKGQEAWIVGSGPSGKYLRSKHIGDGPVIALNDATVLVDKLRIKNDRYSMQKDHELRDGGHIPIKNSTLLVHEHESKDRLPDYEPRYVFDNKAMGLEITDFSLMSAFKIIEIFGCTKINLISFDNYSGLNNERYRHGDVGLAIDYSYQKVKIDQYLSNKQYKLIIPKP